MTTRLWSFLCISLVAWSVAIAEPRRDEYARGVELFAADRYAEAIVEFKSAYDRKPRALILFNIAQAYRKDGHFEEALVFYRRFLASATPAEKAPVAEEAGRYVREIEENLALQRKLAEQKQPPPPPPPAPVVQQPQPPPLQAPEPPPPKPVLIVDKPAPAPAKSTPVYKRWYLWTPVLLVAAGIAIGVGVGVTQHYPSTDLGIKAAQF